MTDTRPKLRDCPMCHASGDNDELVYFTKEVAIASDCEFTIGYSCRCIQCGVSVHDEYAEEVARLWNREAPAADEDEVTA